MSPKACWNNIDSLSIHMVYSRFSKSQDTLQQTRFALVEALCRMGHIASSRILIYVAKQGDYRLNELVIDQGKQQFRITFMAQWPVEFVPYGFD